MKALILWANKDSPNLGVRVLAEGMTAILERAFPAIEVDSLADAANQDGVGLSGRHLAKELCGSSGPLARFIKKYDLVVDIGGGDSFSDIYGLKRLALMRQVHVVCKRVGVPLIIGPQTIGPFSSKTARWMGRSMLQSSLMSVARDSKSAEYAADLGAPVSMTATDVVFALDRPSPSAGSGVVINVSGLLWDSQKHGDSSYYQTAVRGLTDQLISSGRTVTFLAHVLDSPSEDNDCRVLPILKDLYGDTAQYVIPADLRHAREYLSSAQAVIGSRMHACLNALSVGTPAVAWAYSRKFAPLLNDLGWGHVLELGTSTDPVSETIEHLSRAEEGSQRIVDLNERAQEKLDVVVRGLQQGCSQ